MPSRSYQLKNLSSKELRSLKNKLDGQLDSSGFSVAQKREIKEYYMDVSRELKRRQQQNEGRKISRPKTKKSCKKRSMNWVSAHKSRSNGKVIKVRGSCRRSMRL
jgi:hypothetical protein